MANNKLGLDLLVSKSWFALPQGIAVQKKRITEDKFIFFG
jgi:hypothetical protein